MFEENQFIYGELSAKEIPIWCAGLPRLTRLLMDAHYAEQRDLVALHLAPKLTWIGSMEWQFTQGVENMMQELEKENGIERQIVDSEFSVVYADDHCCTVVGWMRAKTPETSGMILAAMQRATFQYALFDGIPKAVHIHVSNSWDVVEENEVFPFRAGHETYQYVQSVLHRQNKVSQKMIVRDVHHRTHFIMVDEIMLIEARASHNILHCVDRRIEIYASIIKQLEELPDYFIRVHRSYVVNANYVIGMERFKLHLCNGYVVPVPEKQYAKINNMVTKQVIGAERQVIHKRGIEEGI